MIWLKLLSLNLSNAKGLAMRLLLLCLVITAPALAIACARSPTSSSQNNRVEAGAASPSNATPLPESRSAASPQKEQIDACTLLSGQDIQAVQGEAVKEAKLTTRSDDKFITSQCFYSLTTFSNSVSLAVTERKEGPDSQDPKEYWRELFDSDRTKARGESDEREEKEGAPLRVEGIGDEAFWSGSRVGGALYVLKSNRYIRVSIGGTDDQQTKIRKLKALAKKAIARL